MDEIAQTLEQTRKAIELNKQGIAKLESQLKRHHQTRTATASQAAPATAAASSNTISPPMMAALAEQQAILLKRVEELRPKQTRQPVARGSAPKTNPEVNQGATQGTTPKTNQGANQGGAGANRETATKTTPEATQGATQGARASGKAGKADPSPTSGAGKAGEADPEAGEGASEEEPATQLRRAINAAKQALKKSDAALARLKVPPAAVDVLIREGHIPSDKLQFARQKMAQIERDANKLTSSKTASRMAKEIASKNPQENPQENPQRNATGITSAIDEETSPENVREAYSARENTTGMAKGISLGTAVATENKNNLGEASPENVREAYSARGNTTGMAKEIASKNPQENTTGVAKGISLGTAVATENKNNLGGASPENVREAYSARTPTSTVSRPKPRKRHISV